MFDACCSQTYPQSLAPTSLGLTIDAWRPFTFGLPIERVYHGHKHNPIATMSEFRKDGMH